MKAAVYRKYGPPEVVSIEEIALPVPKAKEVLIKIHYTTVNRTDCGFRSAEYFISRFFSGLFVPKIKVLGCEFAGEIIEIGKDVSLYKVGDRVFGFNDAKFGGHAEYLTLPENAAIVEIPEGFSYRDAAPWAEGGHYALCNIRSAKITAGQQVLINGGTGAIGSAAIQLCKYFGAEVTAVCATQHIDTVRALGADVVIDYTKEDFTQLKRKFDVVFDAVGKSNFGRCKPLLKEKGIYMSTELGPGFENPFLGMTAPFRSGKKVLFPIPLLKRDDIVFLKTLAEAGKYKPLVDRTYNLSQIVEAYKYVETGMKTGNVLIKVAD
jgi:NADPH:quinone reductase-like Zn-dependent oxidoreductase